MSVCARVMCVCMSVIFSCPACMCVRVRDERVHVWDMLFACVHESLCARDERVHVWGWELWLTRAEREGEGQGCVGARKRRVVGGGVAGGGGGGRGG